MTTRQNRILILAAVLLLLAGCAAEPHTYTDKRQVKLTVPGCS